MCIRDRKCRLACHVGGVDRSTELVQLCRGRDPTFRSLWETLWQPGKNFIESSAQGLEPVLHFDYEIVLDARTFERPVNYALLRITPPDGVIVNSAPASL